MSFPNGLVKVADPHESGNTVDCDSKQKTGIRALVSEAFAGLAAFKTLMDTASGLKNIHDATVRDQAVFTLQREILAAQAAQMSLVEKVAQLEKTIATYDKWEKEKKRYQLTELAPGTAVYLVKDRSRGTDPVHAICTNCYENHQKSILHIMKDYLGVAHINCPRCKLKVTCYAERPNFPIPFPPMS